VIEEQGLVLRILGDVAEVSCQRRSACGGCGANGSCGTSLLETYWGRQPLRLAVTNPIGAQPGDRVVIGLPEASLSRAAYVTYLQPLLLMLVGGLGGEGARHLLLPAWGEWLTLGGGLLGLLWGLRWAAWFSVRRSRDPLFQPQILRLDPTREPVSSLSREWGSGPR